jgi:hypothetical protein
MDHYSILDHDQNPVLAGSDLGHELDMPQSAAGRSTQGSVSAKVAAVNAASGAARMLALRFPGEDGGRSLAEMARRDLDAALQLLAERAQYITEASGAAIALRRGSAQNDMLCRASAGPNAPELGTLLSTEFGLSGESVRTRLPLRCDNADRDPRVNRESCRQLGIASVAVLPIVSDDQVLGVFELFSGKINAFEERDLSALQRLGEMVETAVKLAHAAQSLPPGAFLEEEKNEGEQPAVEVATEVVLAQAPSEPTPAELPSAMPQPELPDADSSPEPTPRKPMLWSAAAHSGSAVSPQPAPDQSHVPPVLRNLHKCHACGFPVSQGRTLCVECEEKQWRGQLRVPPRTAPARPAASAISDIPEATPADGAKIEVAASAPNSPVPPSGDAAVVGLAQSSPVRQEAPSLVSPVIGPVQLGASSGAMSSEPAHQTAQSSLEGRSSETSERADLLFQSSGESWFSANKYIIVSLMIVAAVVVVIALIR